MFCCLRPRSTAKVWSSKPPSRDTLTIFSQCYHWNLWVMNWDWEFSCWEEHSRCDWVRTDVFKRAQSSYVSQSNTYLECPQQLWWVWWEWWRLWQFSQLIRWEREEWSHWSEFSLSSLQDFKLQEAAVTLKCFLISAETTPASAEKLAILISEFHWLESQEKTLYINLKLSLSTHLLPADELPHLWLSQCLNHASIGVVNFLSLSISFPVQQQIDRRSMPSEPQTYPSHTELLSWVTDLDIVMNNLISTHENELWVLQLLYSYWHLNDINLNSLFSTDLIVHCVWLTLSTLSYSAKDQIWWLPHKEWWLRKIVQDDMMSRIYKRMQHVNDKLSA